MKNKIIATYIGDGTTFTCTCGAAVICHEYWWAQQICPECLATYYVSQDDSISMTEVLRDADNEARIRANIAANNGRCIPTFLTRRSVIRLTSDANEPADAAGHANLSMIKDA